MVAATTTRRATVLVLTPLVPGTPAGLLPEEVPGLLMGPIPPPPETEPLSDELAPVAVEAEPLIDEPAPFPVEAEPLVDALAPFAVWTGPLVD
jgi:hypothetical protein